MRKFTLEVAWLTPDYKLQMTEMVSTVVPVSLGVLMARVMLKKIIAELSAAIPHNPHQVPCLPRY